MIERMTTVGKATVLARYRFNYRVRLPGKHEVKRFEFFLFFWLLTLLLDTRLRNGGSSHCSSPFINLDTVAAFIFIKVWASFHSHQCEYISKAEECRLETLLFQRYS